MQLIQLFMWLFCYQVHLSHNFIATAGAKALLAAVPAPPLAGASPAATAGAAGVPLASKALWLRLEWNQINVPELQAFMEVRGIANRVPYACAISYVVAICLLRHPS